MHTTAQPQLGSCAHTASNCGRVASGCVQQRDGHAHRQTKTTRTGHTQHNRPAQKPKPRPRKTATPAARRPPLSTTPRQDRGWILNWRPTQQTQDLHGRQCQRRPPVEPQINLRLVFEFQIPFLNLRFKFSESQTQFLNLRFA